MFTVLHKWDNYNAHSMDLVAKYLYQYYDTQTTEKLCLLFNMLESNTSQDSNHSRWEADDRWMVHADDVAEIDWPGEKRLKRKHNMISGKADAHNQGEEDEKRTKAKRWDTFSKFLARIGFLKTSSKKSMAWVCSWTDNTGIFNRSKLVGAASQGLSSSSSSIPQSPHSSHSSHSHHSQHSQASPFISHPALPAISQNSTPISPAQHQVPLSPLTTSNYGFHPPPPQFAYPPSPSISLVASEGVTLPYQNGESLNYYAALNQLGAHHLQYTPYASAPIATPLSQQPEKIESPEPPMHVEPQPFATPMSSSSASGANLPTYLLSSYLRDVQESPYEYYENRGCAHAVSPMNIMSSILKHVRVRVHRNWENFNFTNRARVEANKQLIETVKECGWEHAITRVPYMKISEGNSISSQIRKQFPPSRSWEPEEYKSILLSVLQTPINQQVVVRQRNLRFKNEKTSIKEVRKETSKAEFRLWSHIEPDTQLVFPPALPSITKAYRFRDSFVHIATGLNLDSITQLKYKDQILKFVKSKTVMIILTADNAELDTSVLMKGVQHVGHNEYPVIPQIVNVVLCGNVPREGTILFGSYLKYVESMTHDTQDAENEFPHPQSVNEYAPNSNDDVKAEKIDFTVLHPNCLCAHTTFSPETLTVKSWFVGGQKSFLGFDVSDSLL